MAIILFILIAESVPYPKPFRLAKLLHKWLVYQSFLSPRKLKENSEAVEKVSMANPCDFRIVKNQQIASHGKSQNDRIWGFSTASADIATFDNV